MMTECRKQYFNRRYINYDELDADSPEVIKINRMIKRGIIEPLKF